MPVLVPRCLSDIKNIDPEFAKTNAMCWKHVWNNQENIIPRKYKYLMAFCSAVGSGRLPQAARELTKAYGEGASYEEIVEALDMLVWNMGVPYFTSEFKTSPAMKVFNRIKRDVEAGLAREETVTGIKAEIIHG